MVVIEQDLEFSWKKLLSWENFAKKLLSWENFGKICNLGKILEKSCNLGKILEKFAILGIFCKKVAILGEFWRKVAILGKFWKKFAILGIFCKKVAILGKFWRKVAILGKFWKKSCNLGKILEKSCYLGNILEKKLQSWENFGEKLQSWKKLGKKMTSSAVNLVMTVIGFTVSTIFIVFVCTRLICARIQYLARRRSSAYTSRSDLSILERGLHGLEPLAVANFPTKKYSDAFFTFAEDTQCTICLAEYRKEDTLRILPSCGHYFHATCIDIWFQQQSTCPVCRISLREAAEKKCFMQPLFSSAVRSQYAMDSLDVDTNQCSSSGPRFSSRLHDNQRANPTTASASNA